MTTAGCLRDPRSTQLDEQQPLSHPSSPPISSLDGTVSQLLDALYRAENPSENLGRTVDNIVSSTGWTGHLTQTLLDRLVAALQMGRAIGAAMRDAFTRAAEAAKEFAVEHPVLGVNTALGALAILVPWAVNSLRFAAEGVVEGEFLRSCWKGPANEYRGSLAARWQSMYGDVPVGSIFSHLQKFGTKLW